MDHIKDYFEGIERLVSRSPVIASHEIKYEEKSKTLGILYGKIIVVDSRIMEFLEMVRIDKERLLMKYRYHLMDSNGSLIFRYDNAPHYKRISTFPHHRHTLKEGKEIVEPAEEPDLSKILDEIRTSL